MIAFMRIIIKLLSVFLISSFTVSCNIDKFFVITDYVDIDVAPQLEITVTEISGIVVDSATVTLFGSQEDFLSQENILQTLITGSAGKVLFKELEEDIYYFYIEKGELNNFYEVVTFSEPLEMNHVMTITCVIR
jgi:hypothetical protein